jgi:hypothetical protein
MGVSVQDVTTGGRVVVGSARLTLAVNVIVVTRSENFDVKSPRLI